MVRPRIKIYQQVKEMALKGITSPSLILAQIPEIKNWRTAKKYIEEALSEISENGSVNKTLEYTAIIENLKLLKGNILIKLEQTKDSNQYIGLMKQILKINDQFISLMQLDKLFAQNEVSKHLRSLLKKRKIQFIHELKT